MHPVKAIASGTLRFGDVEVGTYVLNNGSRMLAADGIERALAGESGPDALDRLVPFSGPRFARLCSTPIVRFPAPDGRSVDGRDRAFVVNLCNEWVDAWLQGEIAPEHEYIARNALTVLRALAWTGISALVDEATTYQYKRRNSYLRDQFESRTRRQFALSRLWNVDEP